MCVKYKDDFDMIALQLVSSDSSGVEMPNLKLKDHHFSFVLFWARETCFFIFKLVGSKIPSGDSWTHLIEMGRYPHQVSKELTLPWSLLVLTMKGEHDPFGKKTLFQIKPNMFEMFAV